MSARSSAGRCATRRREADIGILNKLPRVLALLLPALLAGPAAASDTGLAIPTHEALYHASVRGIPVRVGLRLEARDNGFYHYHSWAEPRGLLGFINRELTETSLFTLADGRVVPISYRKRDEFGDRHSDMRFDPVAGTVQIRYRGRESTVDWEPGIYDLLSLRVALAHDLARGELGEVYRVVDDRGRVDAVDVTVAAQEPLDTPLGRLDTVRLEYYSERRDRLFRLWIAPEMDTALVALEQYEGGELRGRLEIVEYQRLDAAGD